MGMGDRSTIIGIGTGRGIIEEEGGIREMIGGKGRDRRLVVVECMLWFRCNMYYIIKLISYSTDSLKKNSSALRLDSSSFSFLPKQQRDPVGAMSQSYS